jgi:hypothetical protein
MPPGAEALPAAQIWASACQPAEPGLALLMVVAPRELVVLSLREERAQPEVPGAAEMPVASYRRRRDVRLPPI